MTPIARTYVKGAIAPLALAGCLLIIPQHWRDRLKDFQGLLGGMVALGAAVIGYSNLQEQFRAQREAESRQNTRQDQLRASEMQLGRTNLISALLGEVEAILIVLRNRRVGSWFEDIQVQMSLTGNVSFGGSMSLSSDYMPLYHKLGTEIGKLQEDVPRAVVYFYGILQLLFDRIRAAEEGTYDHWELEAAKDMARGIVLETREVEETGEKLASMLRANLTIG